MFSQSPAVEAFLHETDTLIEPMNVQHIVEAVVILVICVSTITANVLIICTEVMSPGPKEAIDLYTLSIAAADLLCGVCVIPLSVYPAIVQDWVYGDIICRLSGYLSLTLWSVCLYTFMWISVDRYLAIRKPLRYEVIQTRTRCQCWIVFTWLASLSLCCPPLLGYSKGHFYSHGYVCMLDLGNMVPYSITLAVLVLSPCILTISYTYYYILSTMYKLRRCLTKEERDYATSISETLSNPDHLMSFVSVLIFWITWMPWFGFRIYEMVVFGRETNNHGLHFWLLWLGVSDCFWKLIIYIIMSPKFRMNLKFFCASLCCRVNSRQPLII